MESQENNSLKIMLSGSLAAILLFSLMYILNIPQIRNFPEETHTIRENIERILKIKKVFLNDVVDKALVGAQGEYAISIKSLNEEDSYNLNEHKVYTAASLYKLWVMAAAYQQIQEGKLKQDEVLSSDIAKLNARFKIASEDAELKEGAISATVKESLTQMITISHNYSALLLTQRVGVTNIINFLKENGFTESSLVGKNGLPTISAYDTALFFEKLHNGELANAQYTKEMLDLLKAQERNNKLPLLLPAGTVIAHKTGELNKVSHDAGIVYLSEDEYIIAILSESTYPPGAVERIASISAEVYKYFNEN